MDPREAPRRPSARCADHGRCLGPRAPGEDVPPARRRSYDARRLLEVPQAHEPLGLPFEAFDDFGRFRAEELMEHPDNLIKRGNGKTTFDQYPTMPIDTTGALDGTHDSSLDGEVDDPFQLIDKLAKSDRVRQSIIRHAFRFYMGRNETLSDSPDADRCGQRLRRIRRQLQGGHRLAADVGLVHVPQGHRVAGAGAPVACRPGRRITRSNPVGRRPGHPTNDLTFGAYRVFLHSVLPVVRAVACTRRSMSS